MHPGIPSHFRKGGERKNIGILFLLSALEMIIFEMVFDSIGE
jgi:hypothetical protein